MRALAPLLAAALLLGSPSRAAEGEAPRALSDRNIADAGRLLVFDVEDLLTAPVRWDGTDWLKLGVGAASATATGFAFDETLREASQRSRSTSRDDVANRAARFGAEYSWATIGGFAVAGWVFDDARSRRVAVDAVAASVIAAGIIGTAGKTATGRYRPNETEATWEARPFSGHASFPSGHTTQAFALAAVVSAHYDEPWVRATSFFVAGCVGLARIHQNAHFASDVVAGAILGTAVGGMVVRRNEERRRGEEQRVDEDAPRITWTPLVLARGGGLDVRVAF